MRFIHSFSCRQAEKSFVRFSIVFIHEMGVIRADNLNIMSPGKFYQIRLYSLLFLISLSAGIDIRIGYFMAHKFHVVIVAEDILEPNDSIFRFL